MIAHLHLVVVHLPAVLAPTAAVILATTGCGKQDVVLKIAAWMLVAAAVFSLASYFTGGPSFEQLESELDGALVDRHAQAGQIAMFAGVALGALAFKILMSFWQDEEPVRALRVGLLCGAVVVSWVMARTAHLGGVLRHPESAGPAWLDAILFV